jgi:NAD(P)-dependent dehydrogenase (short-subunit alcohol dehydrogenase family)
MSEAIAFSELRDKKVLVTGASRGIGYAVAAAFARSGVELTVLAENEEIERARERLQEFSNHRVAAIRCDVTDRASLRRCLSVLDRLDVLVANAGIGDFTPIEDEDARVDAIFDRLIQINLIGAFNTVRSALPLMRFGSRIIFTSSVHGQGIAPPGMGGYTASKGGLDALMRTLARELGPKGINVNAVAPGMVATELTLNAIRKLFAAQTSSSDELTEDQMVNRLNAGQAIHHRPVDVERLAGAYLFLASDAGAAITGQSLNVDHGLSMR